MAKITSKIEEIDGIKYIVERRKSGTIICKSLYDDLVVEKPVEVETLSEVEFKKLMLEKVGYTIKVAEKI